MQAIEIETTIEADGTIHLPENYRDSFGRQVRLVVLFPEGKDEQASPRRAPGSAKGRLNVVAEDEQHLDDFADYMG